MMVNSAIKAKIRKINGSDDSISWNSNFLQLRRAWESWTERQADGMSGKDMADDLINDMGNRAAWEFIKLQPVNASEYTYMEWYRKVEIIGATEPGAWFKPNPNQWIFACAHAEPNSGRTTLSLDQCKEYFSL